MSLIKLKEKDIRIEKNRTLARRLRTQDLKKYFFKNIHSLDSNFFTKVNCPACGRKESELEFVKLKFKFGRCNNCNTLFVSPRPNISKLYEYYKNSNSMNFFENEILEKTKKVRVEKILMPRAKRLLNFLNKTDIPRKLFLEIGGGNGAFIEVFKRLNPGFKKYLIIEPSLKGEELIKKRGLFVINSFFENVNEKLNADCICAFELLEHVFSPFDFCVKVNSLLKKNGIFVMTTLNEFGFDLMLLGEISDNIFAPDHLNYFNCESIKILLKRTGFELLEIETPGVLDVDIVKNKIKKGFHINDRFFSLVIKTSPRIVLENLQKILFENKLSSHMWVVCKKNKNI